jgi:methionine-rich copper-binding protein CopC
MRWVAAAAVLAALAFPAAATGHASLLHMIPDAREEVRRAPDAIELRFNEPVTVLSDSVLVYDGRGRIVSWPGHTLGDGHDAEVAGAYKPRPEPYRLALEASTQRARFSSPALRMTSRAPIELACACTGTTDVV